MSHFVGLDVSENEVSNCVVNAAGNVRARATVAAASDLIAAFIERSTPGAERVVHVGALP